MKYNISLKSYLLALVISCLVYQLVTSDSAVLAAKTAQVEQESSKQKAGIVEKNDQIIESDQTLKQTESKSKILNPSPASQSQTALTLSAFIQSNLNIHKIGDDDITFDAVNDSEKSTYKLTLENSFDSTNNEKKVVFLRAIAYFLDKITNDRINRPTDDFKNHELAKLAKAVRIVIYDFGRLLTREEPVCVSAEHQNAFLTAIEYYFQNDIQLMMREKSQSRQSGYLLPSLVASSVENVLSYCLRKLDIKLGRLNHVTFDINGRKANSQDIAKYAARIDPMTPGEKMTNKKLKEISVLNKNFDVFGLIPKVRLGKDYSNEFTNHLKSFEADCIVMKAGYKPFFSIKNTYGRYSQFSRHSRMSNSNLRKHRQYLRLCDELLSNKRKYLLAIKKQLRNIYSSTINQIDNILLGDKKSAEEDSMLNFRDEFSGLIEGYEFEPQEHVPKTTKLDNSEDKLQSPVETDNNSESTEEEEEEKEDGEVETDPGSEESFFEESELDKVVERKSEQVTNNDDEAQLSSKVTESDATDTKVINHQTQTDEKIDDNLKPTNQEPYQNTKPDEVQRVELGPDTKVTSNQIEDEKIFDLEPSKESNQDTKLKEVSSGESVSDAKATSTQTQTEAIVDVKQNQETQDTDETVEYSERWKRELMHGFTSRS